MSAEHAVPAERRPANPPDRARATRLAVAAILCIVLVIGAYWAWHTWFAADSSHNTLLTATATRGDLEDAVTATGTLQPKEYVDVGTQVSGQLKRLLVDLGATVKAGELLAEIDPSVYQSKVDGDQAQLLNQKALLNDKQAQLALAQLELTRQQKMAQDEASTTELLQTADATFKSAGAQADSIKAQMQQTESTLRGDEASLSYTKIHAPMAGTVVSLTAKQGQTLNANQQAPIVLRIADLSTMTVEAQVSEADVSKLHVGMDVYFTTLGGDNRRYSGKLRQITPTPTVVNNVVLYDALFDVPNPDQTLMTQMTAQVFFIVDSAKNAVLVPVAALKPVAKVGRSTLTRGTPGNPGADLRTLFAKSHAVVSVVGLDGKVSDREVAVGSMNRVFAQITSGLEPGEKVVIGTNPSAARPPSPPSTAGALTGNAPRTGARP